MGNSKTEKYLKYAIGEISLVVIGILIAVNINNWNENRKTRTIEVNYLKNIQADLNAELKNNDSYIKEHNLKAIWGYNLLTTPVGKTKSEQLNLDMKLEKPGKLTTLDRTKLTSVFELPYFGFFSATVSVKIN